MLTIQRDRFHPRVHPFIPLVSAPCLSCLFFINPYMKVDISLCTQKKCGESFNTSLPRWPCVCLLGSNSLVFKFMSNRPARLRLLGPSTEIRAHSCVHACTHTRTHIHPLTCTHMHRPVLETVESSLYCEQSLQGNSSGDAVLWQLLAAFFSCPLPAFNLCPFGSVWNRIRTLL